MQKVIFIIFKGQHQPNDQMKKDPRTGKTKDGGKRLRK